MTTQVAEQLRLFRRNDPGTKREEWCKWPPMSFDEMESTLNVQQFIQQTIALNPADIGALFLFILPFFEVLFFQDGILTPPIDQDDGVWKYEQLRQFCLQLNGLALLLQEECMPETCIQMTATEQWIFLCAAHKNPKEVESSLSKLGSVCRRVYRIFSHAYFHHKKLFDDFEGETHLCKRFRIICFIFIFYINIYV
uniref:Mob1/phocein family protein n=1 Tax=Heterorhabditis bacteriophora TaxID=37862 RepID=A0A1I7WSZ8_HETBA